MRYLLFASSFALVSCLDSVKDSDGDGLSDAEEEELGSDPEKEDSDDDGLSDLEESEAGTDPTEPDSDGDGYSDFDELEEGSDPTDEDSRIYTGNWPYQPEKDSYNAPTSASEVDGVMGELLLRDQLLDQFGDMVDLYDFAGQGKYIAIDLSAMWCGPCHQLAESIATNPADGGGWGSIPQKVHDGDIFWVTILFENNNGRVPSEENLNEWYTLYPDDKVPVLADNEDNDFDDLYVGNGVPTIVVFDENMEYVSGPTSADHWVAISFLDGLTF
jgi:thiol-disulfide isomerase/thioredoxin